MEHYNKVLEKRVHLAALDEREDSPGKVEIEGKIPPVWPLFTFCPCFGWIDVVITELPRHDLNLMLH